jgi:hypothetical protein
LAKGGGAGRDGARPGRRRATRRSRRRGGRHRHVHEVFDALADLRRHHLHALGQFAREQLGFVLRRDMQRLEVADVRVERHGRQGDDREEKKRDDEANAQAHGFGRGYQ